MKNYMDSKDRTALLSRDAQMRHKAGEESEQALRL